MGKVTDKKNYAAYSVTVNGLSIDYRYCTKWLDSGDSSHDHFEFLSHYISDTKCLSHFVHSAAVDSVFGHQQYAEFFCKVLLQDVPPNLICLLDFLVLTDTRINIFIAVLYAAPVHGGFRALFWSLL